jgi:hypothetical protein
MKSLLLLILDVFSGTGVGNRVGSALFAYLTDKVGIASLSHLLHAVADNGSNACAGVTRLFQLVNSHLGSKVLLPSNHIRCADHSVQHVPSERYTREASDLTCEHPPKQRFASVLPIGCPVFGIQQ